MMHFAPEIIKKEINSYCLLRWENKLPKRLYVEYGVMHDGNYSMGPLCVDLQDGSSRSKFSNIYIFVHLIKLGYL